MSKCIHIIAILSVFIAHTGFSADTSPAPVAGTLRYPSLSAQDNARLSWWLNARFGMFIHWDMSSVAGTEISWSRQATKPLDVSKDKAGYVEDFAYDHLYEKFNPQKFDATEWVRLAKAAGMKYIVFTAKHHGGFCMWDTKLTNYSIMSTPFKRDVIKELSDACHKAGMPFGIYYSPRDWHHPDYGVGDNRKYHEYIKGQLTELLTKYGNVDIMWFDSFGHGDSIQYWHADEIMALVRRLQPKILINNRSGFFWEKNPATIELLKGDFDTPEERVGSFQYDRPWESCMCMVKAPDGGWSYRKDGKVKSFEECLTILVGCATGDGNLLLDVGPDSSGEIPADQVALLAEFGAWMKVKGESIYGTRGGPWKPTQTEGSTRKDKVIYVHLLRWTGEKVTLPAIGRKIKASSILGGGKVEVDQNEKEISISVPASDRQPVDTIIKLELDGSAMNIPIK